jgi:hypothetical protein
LTWRYGSVQVEEPTEREEWRQEASAQWSRRSGRKASPPGSPQEGIAFAAKKAGKTPGQASYYSPLAQRVSEENADRREQAKTYQRRTAGYPSEFEMVTDTPLEDLKRIGLWHVLEPVENGVVGADAYVRGIHDLFESERAKMVDIYSADEEVLVVIWQLLMEQITEERLEVPEILRAYCDEWRARLKGNDPQGRVHKVIAGVQCPSLGIRL